MLVRLTVDAQAQHLVTSSQTNYYLAFKFIETYLNLFENLESFEHIKIHFR
jgi:hypothetical protein